jgi:hypothetical protein
MTKRSTKPGAINWRHEAKGSGYAQHVYVTLTDRRQAWLKEPAIAAISCQAAGLLPLVQSVCARCHPRGERSDTQQC